MVIVVAAAKAGYGSQSIAYMQNQKQERHQKALSVKPVFAYGYHRI